MLYKYKCYIDLIKLLIFLIFKKKINTNADYSNLDNITFIFKGNKL